MALETLKGVGYIGGFKIQRKAEDKLEFIMIADEANTIGFRIQDGPIKHYGVNGCQVDTLIHAARMIIDGLNARFPSPYNTEAIIALDMALDQLHARTKDREKRNVEGTSNA